jgi:hypothetical protein
LDSHGRRSFVEKMMWTLKTWSDWGIAAEVWQNLECPSRAQELFWGLVPGAGAPVYSTMVLPFGLECFDRPQWKS